MEYPHRPLDGLLRSRLLDLLEKERTRRALPAQWAGWLANAARRGIRDDEMCWSGLRPWLEGQTGAVERDRILRVARKNLAPCMPELSHCVWLDRRPRPKLEPVADAEASFDKLGTQTLETHRDRVLGYRVVRYRSDNLWGGETWYRVFDARGNALESGEGGTHSTLFNSFESAVRGLRAHAYNLYRTRGRRMHAQRYVWETLHGGHEYREWFVTLPRFPERFSSPHFGVPNLLVHLRTKVRDDTAGARWLFIEEIQSDWHQSGRIQGYGSGEGAPEAPFARSWHELGLKVALWLAAGEELDGVAWSTGAHQRTRQLEAQPDALSTFYDVMIPGAMAGILKGTDARIGRARFETRRRRLLAGSVSEDGSWGAWDAKARLVRSGFTSRAEAERYIEEHSTPMRTFASGVSLSAEVRRRIRLLGFWLF